MGLLLTVVVWFWGNLVDFVVLMVVACVWDFSGTCQCHDPRCVLHFQVLCIRGLAELKCPSLKHVEALCQLGGIHRLFPGSLG